MDALKAVTARDAQPASVASFDRRVLAVAGVVFAVLMALSNRYGLNRDELYMLECARHLQASYVDQPILAPLLARVSLSLFGVWAPGLRLWAALAAGATVVIGGLTARELGGGRRSQLVAAISVATMPVLWGAAHIANTTPYLLLAWAALALVVVRIERIGNRRLWIVAGLVLGIGLADNHLIGFFALATVVAVLLSGGWRLVVNRYFLAGAVIAVVFAVPDIWWQAHHQWAELAMDRQLNHENGGWLNAIGFVVGQLFVISLPLVWVWLAGLRWLWRSGRPLWRGLALAYPLLVVFFAVTTGAKIYYLSAAYVYLFAAGAVAVDGWLFARAARIRTLAVATTAVTAAFVLVLLPVLPPKMHGPRMEANLAESVGWPELVDTVHSAWTALPPAQRANAVIFTENYSEAAAINELGSGLPVAVSGHNTYWWWGPGNPGASTVLVVAPGPDAAPGYQSYLDQFFTDVQVVATLDNPYGVSNIEAGGHVYLCTGPRRPWSQLWPQLRHYD